MELIQANNPEWIDMWSSVAEAPINQGDPLCEYRSKQWQYLGSSKDYHHLRHPFHPKTKKEEYLYIERHYSSIDWLYDQQYCA